MKIVIVASSDWAAYGASIVSAILAAITATPPDTEVAVRGPTPMGLRSGISSEIEKLAATIGMSTGRPVQVYRPTKDGTRASVFRRDFDLVEGASKVLVFYAPGREHEGGSSHVVKAALDRGVPVEAYGVQPDGSLALLGSDDGGSP